MPLENNLEDGIEQICGKIFEPLEIQKYKTRNWEGIGWWFTETIKWPVRAPRLIHRLFNHDYRGTSESLIDGCQFFAPALLPLIVYDLCTYSYESFRIKNKSALKTKPENEFDAAILPDWDVEGNIKKFEELHLLLKNGVVISKDRAFKNYLLPEDSRYDTAKYFTRVDPALKGKLDRYLGIR